MNFVEFKDAIEKVIIVKNIPLFRNYPDVFWVLLSRDIGVPLRIQWGIELRSQFIKEGLVFLQV